MTEPHITPQTIRQRILTKAQARGLKKTCCPSEVARELGGEDWRSLMDAVRQAGIALAQAGLIVVTQQGQVVDPKTAQGPIRYRLSPPAQPPAQD